MPTLCKPLQEGGARSVATITANTFISKCLEIYKEQPTYQLGHDGSDGKCDCIGLVRGALKRAGINAGGLNGTNQAARQTIRNLHAISKASELSPGQVVLKIRDANDESYPLPDKYRKGGSAYNGDLTNYTHIGVVTQTNPLQITHMTSPTAKQDTKLGNWRYVGNLPYISETGSTEETAAIEVNIQHMTVKVQSSNGGGVNLRNSNGKYLGKIPEGTELEVKGESGTTYYVLYNGQHGYISKDYAVIVSSESENGSTGGTVTITLERRTAESLLSALDKALGVG